MRKRILSLALILAILVAFVPFTMPANAADTFTPVTGKEMAKQLKLGFSLAGKMAPYDMANPLRKLDLDAETLWDGEMLEPSFFKAVKTKGFNFVSLLVGFEHHMDDNYVIDKAWMDRAEEVVKMALDEGLYVILTSGSTLMLYQMMRDNNYTEASKLMTSTWSQIAERFKGYSEKLLFNLLVEPHPSNRGVWDTEYMNNEEKFTKFADLLNRINADGLAAIRKSGGNNNKRCVVLAPFGAQYWPGLIPDNFELYKHPANDDYLLVDVHIYNPHGFTHNDSSDNTVNYTDTRQVDEVFQAINKHFISKGIPVVIAETGTVDKNNTSERVKWVNHVFGKAAGLGIPITWWNGGGSLDFILLKYDELEWRFPEILNSMFAAYGLAPGPDFPFSSLFPYELPAPYKKAEHNEWSVELKGLSVLAEKMVVEYEGTLDGYSFGRYRPSTLETFNSWDDSGKERVTLEPGKLTFDMRGLDKNDQSFFFWYNGNMTVKRIYLDGAAPAPTPTPTPTPAPAATVTTSPTANKVLVDGKEVAFDAYNINDENYFKLRDVAFVLNGTRVQFNAALVDGAINIYKNTAYEPNGSEMQSKGAGSKEATLNKMKILIDGVETELTAYLIDGNNYFKMRELAQTFDFYPALVDGVITIDTTKPYGG